MKGSGAANRRRWGGGVRGRARWGLPVLGLALGLLVLMAAEARAQGDATCLMCHASASLFKTKPNPNSGAC